MENKKAVHTKDRLLGSLKRARGAWVSGQNLSEELAMTRTAVWKQIRTLKEEGYEIEASTRKGYRLCSVPDLLLIHEIRDGLKTRTLGQTLSGYFGQTDSTNLRARELAVRGAPEGTMIVAEQQTQGRGRRQRVWFSPPHRGIYVSLILRPAIAPMQAPGITLLAAVALAETLRELAPLETTIKWPNDVLVRGRKIAGILTEVSTGMDAIDHVIVGAGINVNIPTGDFPDGIRSQATSVQAETGVPCPRAPLLRRYLEVFEYYYDLLPFQGFGPVLARWRSLTDMLGRRVRVDLIGDHWVGEVSGFDDEGFLILLDREGRSLRFFSGDVTYLDGQGGGHA